MTVAGARPAVISVRFLYLYYRVSALLRVLTPDSEASLAPLLHKPSTTYGSRFNTREPARRSTFYRPIEENHLVSRYSLKVLISRSGEIYCSVHVITIIKATIILARIRPDPAGLERGIDVFTGRGRSFVVIYYTRSQLNFSIINGYRIREVYYIQGCN